LNIVYQKKREGSGLIFRRSIAQTIICLFNGWAEPRFYNLSHGDGVGHLTILFYLLAMEQLVLQTSTPKAAFTTSGARGGRFSRHGAAKLARVMRKPNLYIIQVCMCLGLKPNPDGGAHKLLSAS
jgi:hypothetical protein